MYYSVNQPPPTISHQSHLSNAADFEPVIRQKKRRLYLFVIVATLTIVGGGVWWYGQVQSALSQSGVTGAQSKPKPQATPQPQVAGATFGDLLKKQRSYAGWLAGVTGGKVVVMNPQSGEVNSLTNAEDEWHGPISVLVWSPDRTKLAYLVLPDEEARGFSQNPESQAKKMGLDSVPSPQTFPFGRAVILDINTKQIVQTGLEVRNTPKSLVWLDDSRLAGITTGLSIYNLAEQQITSVAGAGVTDGESQLQSPVVWNAATESIYFTKVKKIGDQGSRVLVQLSLTTNTAKELTTLRSGNYEEVSISRSVDMALDNEGKRLAFVGQSGIAYLSLVDSGIHALPPQDDWLWLKDSVLSDIDWLSPSRVVFASMANTGSKVWVVWDIPEAKIITFGRGSDSGSWDKASGRLALVQRQEQSLRILTPNWQDPLQSSLEAFTLSWQNVIW